MRGFEKSIHLNRELIRLLDELMESAHWEESLLLRVTAKDFKALRARANNLLEQSLVLSEKTGEAGFSQVSRDQQVLVYICMYQTEGGSLRKWEEALKSLASNSIGRPAYRNEKDAIQSVRERGNLPQEGYVAVYVNQPDIMSGPKYAAQDRFGNELLTLKQYAVSARHIDKFVHSNQSVYRFDHGKLLLEEATGDQQEKA